VDYNLPFIITNSIVLCNIKLLVPGTCRVLTNILIDVHWPRILVIILSVAEKHGGGGFSVAVLGEEGDKAELK
jgi:hypothetical protein